MALKNNISMILGIRRENIADFSKGAGISYSTAHDLYYDKTRSIRFEILAKICDYLQKNPGELFEWTPENGKTVSRS